MSESTSGGPAAKMDLTGVACPFVLAEITEKLEADEPAVLEVISDCPGLVRDLVPAFCKHRGYGLDVKRLEGDRHRLRISLAGEAAGEAAEEDEEEPEEDGE